MRGLEANIKEELYRKNIPNLQNLNIILNKS